MSNKVELVKIEAFILKHKNDISKMEGKRLPMVLAELQGEQANIDLNPDHRTVSLIGRLAFENVFPCYSQIEDDLIDKLFSN
jgi:hypothetical protein